MTSEDWLVVWTAAGGVQRRVLAGRSHAVAWALAAVADGTIPAGVPWLLVRRTIATEAAMLVGLGDAPPAPPFSPPPAFGAGVAVTEVHVPVTGAGG